MSEPLVIPGEGYLTPRGAAYLRTFSTSCAPRFITPELDGRAQGFPWSEALDHGLVESRDRLQQLGSLTAEGIQLLAVYETAVRTNQQQGNVHISRIYDLNNEGDNT